MKNVILALLVAITLLKQTSYGGGEIVIIGKDNNGNRVVPPPIIVEAGQVLRVTRYAAFGIASIGTSTPMSAAQFKFTYVTDTFQIEDSLGQSLVLPGPGTLTISLNASEQKFSEGWKENSGIVFAYEITPLQVSPDKTIVIPADSPGGTISLEMSSDLTNWTPATLGTYSSPVTHLFFRLKLEGQ